MWDDSRRPLEVALFAGENSGDIQAAHLVRAMRARQPDLRAWGVGGPAMAAAGVQIEFDSRHWGAIGIAEAIPKAFQIVAPLHWSVEMLAQRRPPLVVAVDFGAFNRHIVRTAHSVGSKAFWYFPPGSWSREARVGRELADCTAGVATPFPWSEELLRRAGVNARFLGHPLLDVARPRRSRAEFRAELGVEADAPMVAYFPASRVAELRHIWPVMAEAARLISENVPGIRHAVGIAASLSDRGDWLARAAPPGLLMNPDVYDLLNACDYVVTKSGTITLEATVLERPMVIVYKGSRIAWLEAGLLRRRGVRWVGMPNILAGEPICRELLGDEATPSAIAGEVIPWLRDPAAAEPAREALRRVKCLLGEPGGVDRAAEMALGLVASTR